MGWQYFLFDLDGTLTDSKCGILRSVQYALEACGCPEPDETKLYPFMGPPLSDSFHTFCGMDDAQAAFAITKYRERFGTTGIYENEVYPEIPEQLQKLMRAGKTLAVATSKPEVYMKKILAHFHLADNFDVASGSDIRLDHETKADVIRKTLRRLGIPETAPANTVMIGDRKHDILGAHACHIPCIGVQYGYAPTGELEEYGADWVVQTVKDLGEMLEKA